MRREEIKNVYPSQWAVIKAIGARTEEDRRIIEDVTVVDLFQNDNNAALRRYVQLHKLHPDREYYVIHTSRPELNVKERVWIGARGIR